MSSGRCLRIYTGRPRSPRLTAQQLEGCAPWMISRVLPNSKGNQPEVADVADRVSDLLKYRLGHGLSMSRRWDTPINSSSVLRLAALKRSTQFPHLRPFFSLAP